MASQSVASLQSEVSRLRHELKTLKVEDQVPAAGDTIFLADYLLERLVQLGVTVSPVSSLDLSHSRLIPIGSKCLVYLVTST